MVVGSGGCDGEQVVSPVMGQELIWERVVEEVWRG